jgi:hypothetical protein
MRQVNPLKNSDLSGEKVSGIESLNQYMKLVYKLERECTNAASRRDFWMELYQKTSIDKMKSEIGICMVLIHPSFEDVGEKSRSGFKSHISGQCELGKLIHGAVCLNKATERDHIFPLSLGGITSDVNRADLCKSCNRGKSHTVVGYFPWHGETPDWVMEEIWKIRKNIGA